MAMFVNVCAAVAFDNSFQGSQPLRFYLHKLAVLDAIRKKKLEFLQHLYTIQEENFDYGNETGEVAKLQKGNIICILYTDLLACLLSCVFPCNIRT